MATSATTARAALTEEQKKHWNDKGYLILAGFFSRPEVDAVNSLIDRGLGEPAVFGHATVDSLYGPHVGKRFRAVEAPREVFENPIKINDLFLDNPEVRNLALNTDLTRLLSQLLGGMPLVCNSLNFLWGSQQPDHFDTWYMPPPGIEDSRIMRLLPFRSSPPARQDRLAVSSICLEDVHPDAGPLTYYPGSHKLPPYRFSHGGIHAVEAEMPACCEYVEKEIKEAGLKREIFLGKAGDVFLWHGQLLHGGSWIKDPNRTRKTLVTHYWRAQDVEPERAIQVHESGYYLKRDHDQA